MTHKLHLSEDSLIRAVRAAFPDLLKSEFLTPTQCAKTIVSTMLFLEGWPDYSVAEKSIHAAEITMIGYQSLQDVWDGKCAVIAVPPDFETQTWVTRFALIGSETEQQVRQAVLRGV